MIKGYIWRRNGRWKIGRRRGGKLGEVRRVIEAEGEDTVLKSWKITI